MKKALAMFLAVVMMATMGAVPAFARGTQSVVSISFKLDSGAQLPAETKDDGRQGVSINIVFQDGSTEEIATLVPNSKNPSLADLLELFEAGYEYNDQYQIKVVGHEVEITTNSKELEGEISRVEFCYRKDIFGGALGDSIKLATGTLEVKNPYGTRGEVRVGEVFFSTSETDSPTPFVLHVEDHNDLSDLDLAGVVSGTKVYYVLQDEMYSNTDDFKIKVEKAQGASLVRSIRKVEIDFGEQEAFVVGKGNILTPQPAFMLGRSRRTAYEVTLGTNRIDSNIKVSFDFSVEATSQAIAKYAITGNTSHRMEQEGALICTDSYSSIVETSSGSNKNTILTEFPGSAPNMENLPTTANTKIPAAVDKNGNAAVTVPEKTVTDVIQAAQDLAKSSGREKDGIAVVIDTTSGKNAKSIAVTLPRAAIDALVKADVKMLTIENEAVTITLDLATLKQLQAMGGDVVFSAQPAGADTLSKETQAATGSRPVFQLSLTAGGEAVTQFDGTVSVAMPYTAAAGENTSNLYGVYEQDTGKVAYLTNSSYDAAARRMRFFTRHFSTFGVGYKANVATFTDTAGHWAKSDIDFVVGRALLTGIDTSTFSPDAGMTRGMLATALWKLAGSPQAGEGNAFTDVPWAASYAQAAQWASKNGIITSEAGGKFNPDAAVTREQLAVIMSSYAKATGASLPRVHAENTFADSAKISDAAKSAVKQMQMAGVLAGKTGNKLDPQGTATRAQVSALLRRFVELTITADTAQGWSTNDSGQRIYYENGKVAR